MIYNKSFHPDDYHALTYETGLFEYVRQRVPGNIDHAHRRWEYSLALNAFLAEGCQTILEIGSGGSLFAPMAAQAGLRVTVVDPSPRVAWAQTQGERLSRPIVWHQQDFMAYGGRHFDGIACLSVLEHVPDDLAFFRRALHMADMIVAFTVDFSTDGAIYNPYQLRTYDPTQLWHLASSAADWELLDAPDWRDRGPQVYDYNFASLILRRHYVDL